MSNDQINRFRFFLKDDIRKMIDFSQTDQSRGVPSVGNNPNRPKKDNFRTVFSGERTHHYNYSAFKGEQGS